MKTRRVGVHSGLLTALRPRLGDSGSQLLGGARFGRFGCSSSICFDRLRCMPPACALRVMDDLAGDNTDALLECSAMIAECRCGCLCVLQWHIDCMSLQQQGFCHPHEQICRTCRYCSASQSIVGQPALSSKAAAAEAAALALLAAAKASSALSGKSFRRLRLGKGGMKPESESASDSASSAEVWH